MIDPNILGALIGIIFALLTHEVMINFYKTIINYSTRRLTRKKYNNIRKFKYNIVFED